MTRRPFRVRSSLAHANPPWQTSLLGSHARRRLSLSVVPAALAAAACSTTGTMGNEMSMQDIGTPSPGHEIKQPSFGETMKEGLVGNPYRLPPSMPPVTGPGGDPKVVRQMCVDATYDYENQVLRYAMAHSGPGVQMTKTPTDYFKECMTLNGQANHIAKPQ